MHSRYPIPNLHGNKKRNLQSYCICGNVAKIYQKKVQKLLFLFIAKFYISRVINTHFCGFFLFRKTASILPVQCCQTLDIEENKIPPQIHNNIHFKFLFIMEI